MASTTTAAVNQPSRRHAVPIPRTPIATSAQPTSHWTIEGAVTSQFENHIRAICDLPLGDTSSVSDRVVMDNLLGDDALDLAGHMADVRAHVHLYGKAEAREGRKMGHITRVG